jgi:hypothetical protein
MITAMVVALVLLTVVSAAAAFVFWTAWRLSRRSVAVLAHRLDVDAQIEASTLQTMQAMRDAVRIYARHCD